MGTRPEPHGPTCPGRRPTSLTRRDLLAGTANGFGLLALAGLMGEADAGPHFAPKAKNVIFCFMDGGVSHVDSFDPKPKLAALDGQGVGKVDNPTAATNRKWLKSPWSFTRHGQSGLSVSELFPHIASCADDLAVIRSM